MARRELAALIVFLIVVGPITYFVVKEELRQSNRMRNIQTHSVIENEDLFADNKPGVVYFADDDNTYDSRIFEEVYVWHTRSQQPRDCIVGEKDLISEGRPSDPNIET
ncbi:hypothetical protein QZH41_016910 [Actinostola sp. cb2023]|nr:hypothetical protein QZH41_016910 [Actinostola sp. cb2023]